MWVSLGELGKAVSHTQQREDRGALSTRGRAAWVAVTGTGTEAPAEALRETRTFPSEGKCLSAWRKDVCYSDVPPEGSTEDKRV